MLLSARSMACFCGLAFDCGSFISSSSSPWDPCRRNAAVVWGERVVGWAQRRLLLLGRGQKKWVVVHVCVWLSRAVVYVCSLGMFRCRGKQLQINCTLIGQRV